MRSWQIDVVPVSHEDAVGLIERYYFDIIERYYGRPATLDEVRSEMKNEQSGDLPVFFVAYIDGVAAGCVGMRFLGPKLGEITRMFVAPEARGQGLAAGLITELEQHARLLGLTSLRLDTRSDLIEARALYARQGYTEIPAYNDGKYADHWFEKPLV